VANIQIPGLPQLAEEASKIKYFEEDELNRLTKEFQEYYDKARKKKSAGKYWIVFLFLRFTGARISEVLNIDDTKDIDFRYNRVKLITLKRKNGRKVYRTVPVPIEAINELLRYLAMYPDMKGEVFNLVQPNFYKKMQEIGERAKIPKDKVHPHALRHTRAIELINAGMPLNHIQALLGHSSILNTSVYLIVTGKELETMMKEKGLV